MTNAWMTLGSGFALLVLLQWGLLTLFQPGANKPGPLRTILCAVLFPGLSLLIESFLTPYLFQGTLVLQWALFVLLGHRLCRIPLGKSMLAQFCFFSLLLGAGLLEEGTGGETLSQEEQRLLQDVEDGEGNETPEWVRELNAVMLPRPILDARIDAHAAFRTMTASAAEPTPDPPPTPTPARPPATPTSIAKVPSEPAQPASSWTGSDFEALFYGCDSTVPPTASAAAAAAADAEPDPTPLPVPPTLPESGPPEVIGSPSTLTSDQTPEIVKVRNRSTDPAYAAPNFKIGAVSMGDNGRFAMVEGRLIREGSVLRTGGQSPRGWRLYTVTPTELFWQPLE